MRKRKRIVKHANNDVFNGIGSVGSCFSNGNLAVHESCENLIREIEGYVWDAKKASRGVDEPVKQYDHCVDALRYAIYTAFGNRPFIETPPIEKPIDHMKNPGFGDGHGWQTFGGGMQGPPRHPMGIR